MSFIFLVAVVVDALAPYICFKTPVLPLTYRISTVKNNDIHRSIRSTIRGTTNKAINKWQGTTSAFTTATNGNQVDYLITDSIHISETERPSLVKFLSNPRDYLSLLLLLLGLFISICNMIGRYDSTYVLLEQTSVFVGIISTISYFFQLQSGNGISSNIRRGIVDDATIHLYAAGYIASVCWLSLRASEACPLWLQEYDCIFAWGAVVVFFFSLVAPILTLLASEESTRGTCDWMVQLARGRSAVHEKSSDGEKCAPLPKLSETELLRARGLLAIGVLGCVFAPDCIAFALGGSSWWDRVCDLHHAQRALESSTSLFALFATEASMVAHRAGKAGLAPFQTIVPVFAGVCAVLAVIPCVCALYWLGQDVSFFSFYRE